MDCLTVKPGTNCSFMTKKGCTFNGGTCHTIVEACENCARILEVGESRFCSNFPDPQAKWRFGKCNMATHLAKAEAKQSAKVNPLKASKRKSH